MKNIYKKISSVLLIAAGLCANTAQAQVAYYSFTQSTSSYAPVSASATILDTTSSNSGAASLDDKVYPVTLPFAFNLGGTSFTNITVTTNGFITLGTTATPAASLYVPLSSPIAFDGVISAWGRDLNSVFNIGGQKGNISYEVQGVAPNQEFVIQWKNFRPSYTTSTTNAYVQSFQIRLKQTSNQVSIVYASGAYLIGTTAISGTNVQIGLRGASNADFNSRTNPTTSLFTASTKAATNTTVGQAYNTSLATPGMPISGLTYTWIPAIPCAGVPTAGTISAANTTPCPNTSTTLSITGNTQALGITTAWQTSTDGVTFTATGDTLSSLSSAVFNSGDSLYYRVAVSCSGGAPVYTNIVKVKANTNFFQCYCATNLGGGSQAIDSVFITGTTLANKAPGLTSNVSPNYSTFPASGNTTGTIMQALNYTLRLGTAASAIASMWIDYDHSGTFDGSEWTQIATSTVAGNNTVSFTVPINSMVGQTGMRIRTRASGNPNGATDACSSFGSGETEDYVVNIVAGVVCTGAPTAGILSASNLTPCPGIADTLKLTGTTTAVGIATAWQTSIDGVNFTATGDSASQVIDAGLAPGDSIYYRVEVTCNGGAPVYTNVIKLKSNPNFFQCYCSSTATNTADDDIGGFVYGSFTNNVSVTPAVSNATSVNLYTNFINLGPIQAQQVVSSPIKITQINSSATFYACTAKVFVDLDHSGTYDVGEDLYTGTTTSAVGGNVLNGSIVIPQTSLTGLTGLRVVLRESGTPNACGTYSYGETEDYVINITPGVACTNPPTAGTVTASTNLPCPNTATTLTLTGASAAIGIATAWETSANGTTFTATGDSTNQIIDAGLASAGDSIYYRVAVTCNGGVPVYTNIIKIKANPNFFQCYCTSTATSTSDDDIGGFVFGSFTNNVNTTPATTNPGSVNLYTNYTNLGPIQAQQVVAYPITITQINQAGAYSCDVKVFIDLDHSGTYDAGEDLYTGTTTVAAGGNVLNGTISIPQASLTGLTGLRVVLNESTVPSACGTYTWGETEDYIINITPGVQCTGTPTAGTITASNNLPCANVTGTVSLTGTTQAIGISTSWETSIDGITFTATGDSTQQIVEPGVATGDSIYYRVSVACNGGAPVYTNVVMVKANPNFYACYCSTGLGGGSNPIDSVFIIGTTLANKAVGLTSNVSPNYSTFPATGNTTASLMQSVNYSLVLGTGAGAIASVWIDYDHSGTFDGTEWTQIATTTVAGNNSVTLAIPATASLGLTGMRIRTRASGNTNGAVNACTNFGSGETEDYVVNIVAGVMCTGTPTAGSITASNSLPCANTTSTLTLAGTTQAIGITSAWETSTDGVNFTATGDSSAQITDAGLATGDSIYYRVAVACNGGAPVYTNVIKLITNPNFYACYCTSTATNTADDDIGGFVLGSFSNNVSTTPAINNPASVNTYTNYTNLGPIQAMQTVNLPVTITQINQAGSYSCDVTVYIDLDHSGTYDAGEDVYTGTTTTAAGGNVLNGTISIPNTSLLGLTGLRVVLNESTVPTACGTYTWGETEDYVVNIVAAIPCSGTPTAGTIAASDSLPCANVAGTVTLTGTTQAIGITTVWETSTDGINFTPTGDTLSQITDAGLATGDSIYYRFAVACNGGAPVYTNVVMIKTNPNIYACYCSANLHGGTSNAIDSVSIVNTTLTNGAVGITSNVASGYSKFSTPTGTLLVDSTYTLKVSTVASGIISMWIDYDQSGVFDAAEWTQVAATSVAGSNAVTFTVPSAAKLGNTGMRIRTRSTGSPNGATDACTNFFSGETEDYIVNIDTIVPPPVAIAKQLAQVNFVAYPNPTMDIVNVAIQGTTNEGVNCEVLNSFGQIIYTNKVKNVTGVEKLTINLAAYASGSYTIRVTSNNNVTVKRVVLQR